VEGVFRVRHVDVDCKLELLLFPGGLAYDGAVGKLEWGSSKSRAAKRSMGCTRHLRK